MQKSLDKPGWVPAKLIIDRWRNEVDHLEEYLKSRIKETRKAIEKYSNAVKSDDDFIGEFSKTAPETADIYREWKVFDRAKVDYFRGVIKNLQTRLEQRQTQIYG